MKLNSETKIVCSKVVLIPYRKEHVDKYHKWMEEEKLREMTASERLSLEDEYAMQQSWLNDPSKCTFIVLDSELYESSGYNEIESMIGDVNIYLDEDEGRKIMGEISLMIAEPSHRSQGKGKQAVLAMLRYGCEVLNINKFIVRIYIENVVSIAMFEKLNFKLESESIIFEEKTLSLEVTEEVKEKLCSKDTLPLYRIEATHPNI